MKTHELPIFGDSKTVKNQVIKLEKIIGNFGIQVKVRWDDNCGNGHNTFSITGTCGSKSKGRLSEHEEYFFIDGIRFNYECGGCIHDEVEKYFPELKHLIKYHLCSSNAPMYFFENAQYHAEKGDLKAAQSCAVWDGATLEQILDDVAMVKHHENLMPKFKSDLENFGLVW